MGTIIPKNSLILITAVNGFIGAHLANEALTAGYRVRGSVRSISRCSWMTKRFDEQYGKGRFTLVEIPDIYVPQAYEEAVKGADGFIHAAASTDFNIQDLEATFKKAEGAALEALEAAKRGGVKSFTMTSSSWALYTPGEAGVLDETRWNNAAIKLAFSDASPEEKGMAPFMAEKARIERAMWAWVEKEKPSFQVSTVNVPCAFGPVLSAKDSGYGTTAAFLKQCFDNENTDWLQAFPPQWFVDVRDIGKLHLAGLVNPKADRRRILAFAEKFNFDLATKIFKEKAPDRTFADFSDSGLDEADADNRLALELLKDAGYPAFVSLRDSMEAAADVHLANP